MEINELKKKIMSTPLVRTVAKYHPRKVSVQDTLYNGSTVITAVYDVPAKSELGENPSMGDTEFMIMSINGVAINAYQLDIDAEVKIPEIIVINRKIMFDDDGNLCLVMTYAIKSQLPKIMVDPIERRVGSIGMYDIDAVKKDNNIQGSMKSILSRAYKNTTIKTDTYNPFLLANDPARTHFECKIGNIIRDHVASKLLATTETESVGNMCAHMYYYLTPLARAISDNIAYLIKVKSSALIDKCCMYGDKIAHYQFIIDIKKMHSELSECIGECLISMVENHLIPLDALRGYSYTLEDTALIVSRMLIFRMCVEASATGGQNEYITTFVPYYSIHKEDGTIWRYNIAIGEAISFSTAPSDSISDIINGEAYSPYIAQASARDANDINSDAFSIPSMEFSLSVKDNSDKIDRYVVSTIASAYSGMLYNYIDNKCLINYMPYHEYKWDAIARCKNEYTEYNLLSSKLTIIKNTKTYINEIRTGKAKSPIGGFLITMTIGDFVCETTIDEKATNNSFVIMHGSRALTIAKLLNTDEEIARYTKGFTNVYTGYALCNVLLFKDNAIGIGCNNNMSIYVYTKLENKLHAVINSDWSKYVLVSTELISSDLLSILKDSLKMDIDEQPFIMYGDGFVAYSAK